MNTPNLFSQTNLHTQGMPEVGAQFPGGMQAMHEFIRKNLTYPLLALEDGVEGTVVVGFVVTEKGSLEAPEILRSVDFDCDDEALRLLHEMPRWITAKNLGNTVPVRVTLPIAFQLVRVPA